MSNKALSNKALIFICSRSPGINEKRLSHRIARYLEALGVGEIGSIQALGGQLSLNADERRKMIFLNDCNSACVKLLTKDLLPHEFIYIDVSKDKYNIDFDLDAFFNENKALLMEKSTMSRSIL